MSSGDNSTPFCSLPFTQLALYPRGDASLCCLRSGDTMVPGITPSNLTDFINRPEFQKIREEFLTGNIKTCGKDIAERKCNLFYKHLDDVVERSKVVKGPLRRLELRLNGKCNLQCIMCEIWKDPNGYYDNEEFWQKMASEVLPHLHEIEILGGEPFIQKDTYTLLDKMGELNPQCPWLFTTNGHWKFTSAIRDRLDRIKIKRLTISIDSLIAETYAKIRKEGNFPTVAKNVEDLVKYRDERKLAGRGFEIMLTMVLQQENWTEVENYMSFAMKKNVYFHFIYLENPAQYSISVMDENKKLEILAHYRKLQQQYPDVHLWTIIEPLERSLVKNA
jgi:cyclic pyranopterin phosphate synthase